MRQSVLRLFIFSKVLFFASLPVYAVKVYFPDEELATESVLPLVNKPNMVLNRNVPLKRNLELSLGSGFSLTEPFYFPIYPQFQLGFYINNIHSLHLLGSYYFPWLSPNGQELQKGVGENNTVLDAQKAPYPQYSLSLKYKYSPFYGKISLSKNFVLNLSIYGFAGAGMIVSNANDYFPLLNLGIGQKLYLFKWSALTVGLRGDLGLEAYYGPAVARLNLGADQAEIPYSSLSSSQKRINTIVVANAGLLILISL